MPIAEHPQGLTEAMVNDVIKDAMGNTDLSKLHPVPASPPLGNAPETVNPPKMHAHMNTMHQRNYNSVPAVIPGASFQMTLGFGCVHTTPIECA